MQVHNSSIHDIYLKFEGLIPLQAKKLMSCPTACDFSHTHKGCRLFGETGKLFGSSIGRHPKLEYTSVHGDNQQFDSATALCLSVLFGFIS
jgi:hypothetical protein